ncbi:uncharacterized protein JCM15063_000976 [Sporobolomyces koalae]|uniref:uncharacterized protein n=1 Tax=Sporobolomyces koalae TaxID=500713 RepID=UPI003171B541
MSASDAGLPAPRTSKQAKMLGLASEFDQPPPISPASSIATGSRPSQDRSDRGSVNTVQRKRDPIEAAPPWGWPGSTDVRPANKRKPSAPPSHSPASINPSLRGARSASVLRSSEHDRHGTGSLKEKKKGLFDNAADLTASLTAYEQDNRSLSEFGGGVPPPTQYHDLPLPAKLQARGDAADPLPHRTNTTISTTARNVKAKKSKRPVTPNRNKNYPGTAGLTMDPEISLDTNLDSMEGIIACPPDERTRSNSNPDPATFDSRRPSMPPLVRSGSSALGRQSIDPFGHYDGFHMQPQRAGSIPSVAPFTTAAAQPASGTAGTESISPVRPGLGSRQSSLSNLASYNAHDRRSSSIGGPPQSYLPARAGSVFPLANGSGVGIGLGPGAWTAPDSWAVKAESGASLDQDSTDDEDDEDDEDDDQEALHHDGVDGHESDSGESPNLGAGLSKRKGSVPPTSMSGSIGALDRLENRMGSIVPGSGAEKIFGHGFDLEGMAGMGSQGMRPGTARPGTRGGRPGTADGEMGRRPQAQKSFMIRIFRLDGTFSTLPVTLSATASDLTAILARRFQVNSSTSYSLYLREKGLERRVGPNEKPVLLQKRKFEQAGYNELDKLEELGREDNSYLSKLVYKATYNSMTTGVSEEDLSGDNLEFVDLSGRNLETVPIFLYKHAHEIRSLNLSKNRPFDLPTDFVQLCTSLRELVLSSMGIKRLPQAIRECDSLTRLDISSNNIVDLEHIALDELTELSSLKCHNNRLSSIPDYFRQIRQLKYLNLSNNRFEVIPTTVCDILSLFELDISFNTATSVPHEIGKLRNLERLNLLANLITTLPLSLASLTSLKELDCRRNVITDLSPIAGIASLEVLRCEHNQASVLDAAWDNMRILTAKHNSLTRFSLTDTGRTLTTLNLSYGKLSTLSTDLFENLGSLETLILDSNTLRILPETLGTLTNLVTFSIKNNLLTHLPESVGQLQRLASLQVSGNNLHDLPPQIWLCSQLATLNASSNLIKDFPDPPLTSSASSAPLNSPQDLDGGIGEALDMRKLSSPTKAAATTAGRIAPPLALALQHLFLGDNQLGDDIFAPISIMTELRVLNLSFNDIYEIPSSSLFKCQQLQELYLSGNKLTSLPPDDLERLMNLRIIYLNGNKLQTLPAELGKIKRLFALDVGSNVLKYNIANWPYDWNWNWNVELRYLNLSGNKRLEIKPGQQNEANFPRGPGKKRNLADFTALTKLHVLGLMDVTLMIPSVPDENEDRRVRTSQSEINDMGYGIADTLGSRFDTLSLVDIVIPRFRSKEDEAIFGLFDAVNKGQNTGAKLVKYLQDSFSAVFTLELSRLKSGEVTSDALRRAFLNINRDYGNLLLPDVESRRKGSEISLTDRTSASVRSGAAGIIVYIRKKRMYIANAGNALAVIAGRGGTARLVAKRHEPFDSGEISRIRQAEGWISHRGYVNDEVDISRSFGFYNVFPAINAAPNVDDIELTETDEFVIIANRGLWEHMSYQAAVDVARTERDDPMAAAAKLRDLAISYGSSQNIMVMVLAVGHLFKDKKKAGYFSKHRGATGPGEEEGFYGTHKAGVARRGERAEGAGERYLNLLDREVAPPVGMVALVFTDIRNSTALWESNPGMQTAIRMHNQLLRRQLRAIGGYEVKTEGDAFMVSFPTVTSALLWCLTTQLELLREDWPQEILDSDEGREILDSRGEVLYRGLSVRMGIHWGAPVCEADPITRRMDYFGPIVNRAARISAVAEGGHISASQDVVDIIQNVVMDHKPGPSSLDSDNGEEDEEEDYLDPRDKQDIAALRRLGFGISELGERKLKGLESAELISLIWPKSLKERVEKPGEKSEKKTEVIEDDTPPLLDVQLIKSFGKLVQRLESVGSLLVHGFESDDLTHPAVFGSSHPQSDSNSRPSTPATQALAVAAKRRTLVLPTTLTFPVRADATDDELAALLESYIVRTENVLSTLALHQLGPFTEVLSALGQALRLDGRSVLLALTRFAGVMQAGALSLDPSSAMAATSLPSRTATPTFDTPAVATPSVHANGRPLSSNGSRALSPLRNS